jgi:S-DNA-T family DNA segregation ATPase FtsK/SpoIIIE
MKFFARSSGKAKTAKTSRSKTAPKSAPQPPMLTFDQRMDIVGVLLALLGVVTLFAWFSNGGSGTLSGAWIGALNTLFGYGTLLLPLLLIAIGAYLLWHRFGDTHPRPPISRLFGLLLGFVTALATLHLIATAGGELGRIIAEILRGLGELGAVAALLAMWLLAFTLVSSRSIAQIIVSAQSLIAQLRGERREKVGDNAERVIVPRSDPKFIGDRDDGDDDMVINTRRPKAAPAKTSRAFIRDDQEPDPAPSAIQNMRNKLAGTNANQNTRPAPSVAAKPATQVAPINTQKAPQPRIIGEGSEAIAPRPAMQSALMSEPAREWKLPEVPEMLEVGKQVSRGEDDLRSRAHTIEDTLLSFGVPAKVVEVNPGPTITQFCVEPGFVEMKNGKQVKVKVSRIAALSDDLALSLAAPRIRVEAPVPGKGYVGIEVPNGETALVSLRDVMESDAYENLARKTRLRLGLGEDVSGHPVTADLTIMPHMLIAGTTGSGKSVCVNSIITALLINNSPEDLRFLMVDPKRVELTGYNGIPHLIAPVVVDLEQVTAVLKWVTGEMDRRYRNFAKHGARNIVDYNTKVAEQQKSNSADKPAVESDLKKLPYIVVIIDELADLMMLSPDETEKTICRLAQMARATGIHLILATQRPSVDVVTGLIKANFPARIAFTVASSVDSRVIIDQPGAEKLLGRGDMLVMTPDQPAPQRAQGCFLSDKEIQRVVRHWRAQVAGATAVSDVVVATQMKLPIASAPMDESGLPNNAGTSWQNEILGDGQASGEGGKSKWGSSDSMFDEAVATVRLQGKASISLLQRRLRIGYTRSARIIEEMEEKGIVGPTKPGEQFREVLPPRAEELGSGS